MLNISFIHYASCFPLFQTQNFKLIRHESSTSCIVQYSNGKQYAHLVLVKGGTQLVQFTFTTVLEC